MHSHDNKDSKLSKIRFSVGPGKRSDFTKPVTCSPSPNNYSHKSLFEKDLKKGKTFGNSREKSPDRSYHKMQVWNNPSPNQVLDYLQSTSQRSKCGQRQVIQ